MGVSGARDGHWVMEQQPGPVNWAVHNPSPAAGMVRLWSLEAFAHGARVVSYFRWRQARHAQEQMHAGLLRPDSVPDVGHAEAARTAQDIDGLHAFSATLAASNSRTTALPQVVLVVDFEAQWTFDIQPQGGEFSYVQQAFSLFSAARGTALCWPRRHHTRSLLS